MAIDGVVLFHGAGSNRDHSSFVLLEQALAPIKVARIDFPYRRAGKKMPDRAPILLQCVYDEVRRCAYEWGTDSSQIVIGGRSMGGRMCSMAVADSQDPLAVAGLILLAYPLHPPGKPEKSRTEHLHRVSVPSLWISGTRDTFGSTDELSSAMEMLAGPSTAHFIAGKGHDLKSTDADIASIVCSWMDEINQ
jgi:predicted alpha/beta-hydrolase family hydrolase